MKSNIKDFLFITGIILIMLPIFYMISNVEMNIYSFGFYVLILYPTLSALINGAPFVPTPFKAVNIMLKEAKLKKGEKIYDIGCGDGRIVHLASKNFDVNAVGFELSPFVYVLAKIRQLFWRSKAKIRFANFKRHDLSDADVIFCYLLPETLVKLEPKLSSELKKGARIISYAFPIENWREKKKIEGNPHLFTKKVRIAPIWIYEKS